MIKFTNILRHYILGDEHWQFGPFSFDIPTTDTVCVIGHSGSGKSTLLHLLGSLDTPTSGEIIVENIDITTMDEKEKNKYRSDMIGFVFQDFHLFPELTVQENIRIALEVHQSQKITSPNNIDKAINEIIQKVELSDKKNHKPSQLSGGQRQRVAIARAVVHQPRILLADEPTGNLDKTTGEHVMELLFTLSAQNNMGFWCVTHDQSQVSRFDWVVEIEDGKLKSIRRN